MQVLFVLSADRPLTESEVKFLQYVRQWGKKVVFVVNKVGGQIGWQHCCSWHCTLALHQARLPALQLGLL